MTDGSKKGDEGSSSSPDHEADSPVVHDDLPEILEIFGSAPLVQDSEQPADSEFNGASWKTTDPQQQEEADEPPQPPHLEPIHEHLEPRKLPAGGLTGRGTWPFPSNGPERSYDRRLSSPCRDRSIDFTLAEKTFRIF